MTWIILGPVLLWISLVQVANDGGLVNPDKYSWHCYKTYKPYSTARLFAPYPFRVGKFDADITGNTNQCTGEVYNGQWWYKSKEAYRWDYDSARSSTDG